MNTGIEIPMDIRRRGPGHFAAQLLQTLVK
jgi:hypothetical protein